MEHEAIVAVPRWSAEIWDSGQLHTRSQFPLILAWACTIHKVSSIVEALVSQSAASKLPDHRSSVHVRALGAQSQGLTLSRVLIDAGDDEKFMGLLFVALTRVRHPSHVAFDPVPSLERISTNIARKAALHQRKKHEVHLRTLQRQTSRRYVHHQPPQSALDAEGNVRRRMPPPPPPSAPSPIATHRKRSISPSCTSVNKRAKVTASNGSEVEMHDVEMHDVEMHDWEEAQYFDELQSVNDLRGTENGVEDHEQQLADEMLADMQEFW
jgi:hypothetical protein